MQTSTQISTFNFQENLIRVVSINNSPWFIAKDVFKVLGVKNPSDALTRLEPDERSTLVLTEGTDGNPNINIISESGFYTIVLSSRKPIAKPFKNWVTREVLPQLQKYGYYKVPGNTTIINDIQVPPVQEEPDIILDTLIANLNLLKQTKQQLNKVEEITKIHTSALNKVEDITKLHTGALQEVESITKLQADSLEDLESIISDQHSLVVDRLYSIEERLNAQRVTHVLAEDNITDRLNAPLSSFNYVNNNTSCLPAPSKQLPDIGIETHLNNIVKSYVIQQQCQNNNITFQIAYNLLYKKFLDIFHINIKARCEEHNRYYSPKLTIIKYAVKFDLIQDLYNTAYNLFITGNI